MTPLARLEADLAEIDTDIAALRASLPDAADAKSHSEAFGALAHTNQDIDALNAQISKLRNERRGINAEINALGGAATGSTTIGYSY
jgi:hypothetical protein